jgi:hypothetical protein
MPVRAIGFFQDTLFASTAQLDGVQINGVVKYVADTAFIPCWSTEVHDAVGAAHLQLSPVPCSDRLIVSGIPNGTRELVIMDALGRVVLQIPVMVTSYELDVHALLPGAYTVQVLGPLGVSARRFVKQL